MIKTLAIILLIGGVVGAQEKAQKAQVAPIITSNQPLVFSSSSKVGWSTSGDAGWVELYRIDSDETYNIEGVTPDCNIPNLVKAAKLTGLLVANHWTFTEKIRKRGEWVHDVLKACDAK